VDVKFIGSEENARSYVLKYLTKAQNTYWRYEVYQEDGKVKVRVRLSTCFMWYFRVKLFFASRSIRRPKRKSSTGWRIAGLTNAHKVWRFFYKPLGISKHQFWSGFLDRGGATFDIIYLYSFMPRNWAFRA
jgi:hypothetical protein